MAFRLPNFNLTVGVWRAWQSPATDPPALLTSGNLALGRRVSNALTGGQYYDYSAGLAMELLLPKGTDVRSYEKTFVGNDYVEVPFGSGRYYQVTWVDDVGKGFANEYRLALLTAWNAWPVPIP